VSKAKSFAGITSVDLSIYVQDTRSTTGEGLAIVHNTAGLVAEYRRYGQSSWVSIPLVPGTLGTFVSGGLVADGSLLGSYSFCPPNLAFASGARSVQIRLYGAANMFPVMMEFELDAVNYQDASAFGLSKFADIETDTQDVQARIPDALVNGNIKAIAQQINTNAVNANALAADAVEELVNAIIATYPTNFNLLSIASNGSITVGVNNDKTGYGLSGTSQNAIVAAIEVEILNDATGGAVIAAIANAVVAYFDNATADVAPTIIAAAVRNNLTTELGHIVTLVGRNNPLDATQTQAALATQFNAIPVAVDTRLSTTHGSGQWTGSGGGGSTTGSGAYHRVFRVVDVDTTQGIAGALIVAEKDGETVAWGWTDSTGKLDLLLDAGDHALAYRAFSYSSDLTNFEVTASSDTPVNLELERLPTTQPPAANLSSISMVVLKGGTPVQNAIVKARLVDQRSSIASGALVHTVSDFTSNSLGEGTLILPYSSSVLHGDGIYRITVQEPNGEIFHSRDVTVPDSPTNSYANLPNA
jgi:hypothetical protein